MHYLLTLLVTAEGQTKLAPMPGFSFVCDGAAAVAEWLNDEFEGGYASNAYRAAEVSARLEGGQGVAAFRMGPKLVGVATEIVERPQ